MKSGDEMVFQGTGMPLEDGTYHLFLYSPYSAYVSTGDGFIVGNLKSSQSPVQGSFDPACDLMGYSTDNVVIADGKAVIENCSSSGTLTDPDNSVGGILGGMNGGFYVELTDCHSTMDIVSQGKVLGGIVGNGQSGDGSSAGKIYVYENGFPGAVSAQVYADFSQVSASTGYVWPMSFDFDTDGSMVVAVSASTGTPSECFKLYRVASKGATPAAFFGSGVKATSYATMADGSAANASFAPDMLELAFDGSGNLFIADQYSVREIVRGATGLDDGTLVTL